MVLRGELLKACSSWSALVLVACAASAPPPAPLPTRPEETTVRTVASPEPEAIAEARCPEAWQQARAWAFSGDGRVFAVALPESVEVYETGTWTRRFRLPLSWYAETLRLSAHGRWLYAWLWPPPEVAPAVLSVVDVTTGAELGRREVGEHDVDQGFVSAPDGSWIAISGHTVGIEPARVERITLPEFAIVALDANDKAVDPPRPVFTPRKLPAGAKAPNSDAQWDLDAAAIPSLDGSELVTVRELLASEDSRRLIIHWGSVSASKTSVVDAASGKPVATLTGGAPTLAGDWMSLLRVSGAITLWNLQSNRGRTFYDPWCAPAVARGAVVFSPDASLMALPGNPAACLVETRTAKLLNTLPKAPARLDASADAVVPERWTDDAEAILLRKGREQVLVRRDGEPLPQPARPAEPRASDSLEFVGTDPTGRWGVAIDSHHEVTVWKIIDKHAELHIPGCLGESDE